MRKFSVLGIKIHRSAAVRGGGARRVRPTLDPLVRGACTSGPTVFMFLVLISINFSFRYTFIVMFIISEHLVLLYLFCSTKIFVLFFKS